MSTRTKTMALALALAASGCPAAHIGSGDSGTPELDAPVDLPDGGAPDAPDAANDAPSCRDRDGDGAGDPACGGADCDDLDPAIAPGSQRCVAEYVTSVCGAGMFHIALCAGAEGRVCDYRTGACALTACGDGVLHDGESCDDGNELDGDACAADCRWPICVSNGDCPTDAPSCSEVLPDGVTLRCRPLASGVGVGERCTGDADCASGWCDEPQGRCTQGCADNADCVLGDGWCADPPGLVSVIAMGPQRCGFGCYGAADCPASSVCVPTLSSHFPVAAWQPSWCMEPGGPGTTGDFCAERAGSSGDPLRCHSRVCAWMMRDRPRCTRTCVTDADCPLELPYCRINLSWAEPRPLGWREPFYLSCSSTDVWPPP